MLFSVLDWLSSLTSLSIEWQFDICRFFTTLISQILLSETSSAWVALDISISLHFELFSRILKPKCLKSMSEISDAEESSQTVWLSLRFSTRNWCKIRVKFNRVQLDALLAVKLFLSTEPKRDDLARRGEPSAAELARFACETPRKKESRSHARLRQSDGCFPFLFLFFRVRSRSTTIQWTILLSEELRESRLPVANWINRQTYWAVRMPFPVRYLRHVSVHFSHFLRKRYPSCCLSCGDTIDLMGPVDLMGHSPVCTLALGTRSTQARTGLILSLCGCSEAEIYVETRRMVSQVGRFYRRYLGHVGRNLQTTIVTGYANKLLKCINELVWIFHTENSKYAVIIYKV